MMLISEWGVPTFACTYKKHVPLAHGHMHARDATYMTPILAAGQVYCQHQSMLVFLEPI